MGSVSPAWRASDAVTALAWITGWPGTTLHLHVNGEPRRVKKEKLGALVARLEDEEAPEMSLELTGGRFGAMWVRVEGEKQNRLLSRFRPLPTLVLREGASSRRTALWWLSGRPDLLSFDQVTKGGKRIAYALGAKQKLASPDEMRFPVPGTALRLERSRPVPIVVERLTLDEYRPRAVVGRLKDPPTPTWNQT